MSNLHRYHYTRIAPTPSGYLHLGNILSFIITAGLATQKNAKVLLRIDDLDRERADEKYVQDVFDSLNYLGIDWDAGPKDIAEYRNEWSQIHRIKNYEDALLRLKESGAVFACTCSRSQLKGNPVYPGTCRYKNIPLDAPGVSWRLNTDSSEITVNTLQGIITTTLPAEMQYFIVRKKDGYPAYQLSSVVDDVFFGVDMIVRGQDLWPSTLAQLYLAKYLHLSFGKTVFYHHPLLLGTDGTKLSKSAGATSIKYMREQGLSVAEVLTAIAHQAGIGGLINNWQQLWEKLRAKLM